MNIVNGLPLPDFISAVEVIDERGGRNIRFTCMGRDGKKRGWLEPVGISHHDMRATFVLACEKACVSGE